MKLITLFALLITPFLISCQAPTLVPDGGLSAIDAGYPTAEFRACGRTWHGLGICSISKGDDLSKLGFEVQGYADGTIRADSVDCSISALTRRYSANGSVDKILKGPAERSCVVTFTVSPEYPAQRRGTVVVNGFRGHLRVKVVAANEDAELLTSKVSGLFTKFWRVDTGDTAPVRVQLFGCDRTFDKVLTPAQDRSVMIPLHEAVGATPRTCVLEGTLSSPGFQNITLSAIVSRYISSFNPLSIPDVTFKNSGKNARIIISADPQVSALSVGSKYEFSSSAEFPWDKTAPTVIRALTVKGRSVIGIYSPNSGEISWKQ